MAKFKMVDFVCCLKMQVQIEDNATNEEIIEKIEETFDLIHEYGSRDFDEIEDFSAYMIMDNIRLVARES